MKAFLLAVCFALGAAAQTYTVAGVVVDVAHGKPLERARVSLLGGPVPKLILTTGTDGRFTFDVPRGRYSLVVQQNSWGMTYGNREPTAGFGSAVITGADQDTAHLTFRWFSPAQVFGTVADELGEPVRDATVQLFRDGLTVGRRRILAAGTAKTDDRGQFRLGPVASGSYYLIATGWPWQETAVDGPGGRRQGGESTAAYPPTYYPGVIDSRQATALALAPGGEVRADIVLRAIPGATVKIRCAGSGLKEDFCVGSPALTLYGIGGVELPSLTHFDYETQSFDGVPPGRYGVRASTAGKTAFKIVEVGSGEFTFSLNVQPPASISGTVVFQHPLPARATAYVSMENETTGAATGYLIAPDGSFSSRVTGDFFRPRLYGSVPLFINELMADDVPIKNGVVDLTGNTNVKLRIVASDEVGRLRGFATNGEQAAPAVLVVLAPSTPSTNPTHYRGFQTESDGSFDFVTVPADDYLLFAVDRLDLEYTNPVAIQPYLSSAIPVHIAPKAVVEQRVAVAAAAQK